MAREGIFNSWSKFEYFRGNKRAVKGWEKRKAGFLCDDNEQDCPSTVRKVKRLETIDTYSSAGAACDTPTHSDDNIIVETTPESTPVIEEECTSSDELLLIEDDDHFEKVSQRQQQSQLIGSFTCSNQSANEPVVIAQEVLSNKCYRPDKKTTKPSFMQPQKPLSSLDQWSPHIKSFSCSNSQTCDDVNLIVQDEVTNDAHCTPKKQSIEEEPINIVCESSPDGLLKSNKSRPSEWLKMLAWQVEPYSKDERDGTRVVSRSKRYSKSGLSYRWQQVVAREHAATAIWRHELNTAKQQKAGVLRVHLLSVKRDYSLYVTTCKVLSGTIKSSDVQRKFSQKTSQSRLNLNSCTNENVEQIVVFPSQKMQKWLPRVGCVVKIYAPWKLLTISGCATPLVLSSFFEEENCSQDNNS